MSVPQLAPTPIDRQPPRPPDTLRRIFFGPDELRAGWRLLLFLVLLFAIGAPTAWLTSRLIPALSGTLSPRDVLLNEARRFFVVFLASYVMARIEHRSIGDYGLPSAGIFGRDFWLGSMWGFTMVSAIIGLMTATQSYSLGELALPALAALRFGLLWALAFLAVGFMEEFAFRGYLQFTLTRGLGFWPATAVTCALFAWVHHGNPGETWFGLLNIVLIALFICLALRRTGSLWFPIGWHLAFDWGESFFYSVPDSGTHVVGHLFDSTIQGNKWLTGGTVGPEASVFNVLVTLVGIVVFTQFYPQARYPRAAPKPGTPAPPAVSPGPAHPAG